MDTVHGYTNLWSSDVLMKEEAPFPPEPQKQRPARFHFRYLDAWELEDRYRSDAPAAADGEADRNNGQ